MPVAAVTDTGIGSVRTTCPYCGVGCGILASKSKNGTVIKGDPDHPANFGRLCSKGSALAETLSLDDRLLHPEINGNRVNWDNALTTVAERIKSSIEKHGPDSVAFYVSGQLLTEDYYVANKLMKGFIGSANIDTNSRLCMSSAVAGYKRAFGADLVPCEYSDLEIADLIVITGSNPAWCHPVIYQRISAARENNPGLKVVVIDPRRTATCDIADLHLQLKAGTDVMLFNGLLNFLRKEDVLDLEFLETRCEGFAAATQAAKEDAPSIPKVAQSCNLPERDVAEFFRLFMRTEKTITFFSQGINQSSQGTDKVNAIINCHLATGRIGKPGTGPFSITGQPNAMGGREVGGLANQLAAHMELDNPVHRETVQEFWKSKSLPESPGLKAVDLFRAIDNGQVKVLWIMATNPVDSMPDADSVRSALGKCETVIVSDCIRQTDTTREADILLPAQAWGEKDGTVTNSERRISRQRAFLDSPGEARPDWWIITEVAKKLGYENEFSFASAGEIFREHATLSGFRNNGNRDFDISFYEKINNAQYTELEPFQWPAAGNVQPGTRLLADGQYFHENRKARLIPVSTIAPVHTIDTEYPYVLNTGRVRDHWHTLTRTGKSSRLSQHTPEPYVAIHPLDAARVQIENGTLVMVTSQWGKALLRCRIDPDQSPGNVFVPIHWNDQYASCARIDSVVNAVTDPYSGQPELKYTPVNLLLAPMAWVGFLVTRTQQEDLQVSYWSARHGEKYWHYEISGSEMIVDWYAWAKNVMKDGDPGSEWLEYSDTASGCYRAAYLQKEKLDGCLFVARTSRELPDRQWICSLFSNKPLEPSERASLLAGKSPSQKINPGPTVCSCYGIGRNTIMETIRCRNLTDHRQIGQHLQAGTNCGSCIPELKELLQVNQRAAVST